MKRYLTLFFLLIASIALCAYPEGAINNIDGSVLGWDEASQTWRPIAVNSTGGLTSSSDSPVIASISIDTSSIDSSLSTMSGKFDEQIQRNIVNTMYTSRLSITANTATLIEPLNPSSQIDNTRVYLELRAVDSEKVFYIGTDNTVSDSTGRPVKGRILLNLDYGQTIYIYHTESSSLAVQQTEGWN